MFRGRLSQRNKRARTSPQSLENAPGARSLSLVARQNLLDRETTGRCRMRPSGHGRNAGTIARSANDAGGVACQIDGCLIFVDNKGALFSETGRGERPSGSSAIIGAGTVRSSNFLSAGSKQST